MPQKKSNHFLTRLSLRNFFFFSSIGALGTAVHFAVLIAAVKTLSLDPVAGSVAGFACGALVNYFLNYYITFNSRKFHWEALPKFLFIASIGLIINTLIMTAGTRVLAIDYIINQIISTFMVLLWTFIGNCCWTFREETSVVGK